MPPGLLTLRGYDYQIIFPMWQALGTWKKAQVFLCIFH